MDKTKQQIAEEGLGDAIESFLNEWVDEGGTNTTHGGSQDIAPPVRSEDRNNLINLFNDLKDIVNPDEFDVIFAQDVIRITPRNTKGHSGSKFNPILASLLEYMIEEGMKIQPLPEIKIRRDVSEANDILGKTAHYNPVKKEVVLYVEGRHPKDVLRSFVHEMVHHMQNLEGRLQNINTSNVNEDSYLEEIETEAYLKGNITFRKWEDKVKKDPELGYNEN